MLSGHLCAFETTQLFDIIFLSLSFLNCSDGLAGCYPDRQGYRRSDGIAGFDSRRGTFTPGWCVFIHYGFIFTTQPCNAHPDAILELFTLGAKRNTLRAFAGSLRPAASGMLSYLNFCIFADKPVFPVGPNTARLRSCLFRPGRTFAQYLSHLMKATILLQQPTDWMSPDIRSVARGLANAQDLSFRFQNFMFAEHLLRLIRHVKLATEFGQAAFLSFLCLLRAPSETLMIRIAAESDLLTDFSPQEYKVLAGTRAIGCSGMFLMKFPHRKNIKHGCILRRPCLCGEPAVLARIFCPAHTVWPIIKARCAEHERISLSLSRSNFNRLLKSSMLADGFSQGGSFSSHCFRRGATQEIQMAGGSTDRIKEAGFWKGMGFRPYIDTQLTGALKVSRLTDRPTNSDSEDDYDSPSNIALGSSIRAKLRPFPGRTL